MSIVLRPHDLRCDAGHLLVRTAINRNDWIADAVFDIAAGGQTEFTPPQWDDVLSMLDASDIKIGDWI